MKAGTDLDEGADAPADGAVPAGRAQDSGQKLESRGFSCAVRADDTDGTTPIDAERDIANGPELLLTEVFSSRAAPRKSAAGDRRNEIAKAGVALAALEFLPDVIEDDEGIVIHNYQNRNRLGPSMIFCFRPCLNRGLRQTLRGLYRKDRTLTSGNCPEDHGREATAARSVRSRSSLTSLCFRRHRSSIHSAHSA
jgi:hypothetical protein